MSESVRSVERSAREWGEGECEGGQTTSRIHARTSRDHNESPALPPPLQREFVIFFSYEFNGEKETTMAIGNESTFWAATLKQHQNSLKERIQSKLKAEDTRLQRNAQMMK